MFLVCFPVPNFILADFVLFIEFLRYLIQLGTRLRSWVSGVFNEMRQKNPALKKWVDSAYGSSSTIATTTSNLTSESDYVVVPPIPVENEVTINSNSSEVKTEKHKIANLADILISNKQIYSRSTQELCKIVPPIVVTKSENNLSTSSHGNLKVETLYQKLNENRECYELLTKKRQEIKRLLQTTTTINDLGPIMDSNQSTMENFEFSFDETFAPKHDDEGPHRGAHSDDDDLVYSKKLGRSSTIKTDSPRSKFSLTEIGRRFSEIHVDNDTSAFVPINESNNSCPNSSSLLDTLNHQQRHDSDKFLLEASLTPVRAQSVPASPIPKQLHKKYLKRDGSLSESPRSQLLRDCSFQSDSSHRSSVESLLDARKPDPEIILANLGFGPAQAEDVLAKIPRRFLKPSQVRGVDTEKFLKKQQVAMTLHENSVLGYRGLIGNPHIQPSNIVAKILERFKFNEKTCDIPNET